MNVLVRLIDGTFKAFQINPNSACETNSHCHSSACETNSHCHSRSTASITLRNFTLEQITEISDSILAKLVQFENIPAEFLKFSNSFHSHSVETLGNIVQSYKFESGFPLCLNIHLSLLGGKGGFGSLLKAEGKRNAGVKTTNFESSRDLSGRRIRSVTNAQKLADFIQNAPERKRQEKEKLLDKLKETKNQAAAAAKVETKPVDNSVFLKEREKVLENMSGAIEKALQKAPSSSFKVAKVAKKAAKKSAAFRDDEDSD